MKHPDKIAAGIAAFAEAELLPALDGWRLWAGSAALALASGKSGELIGALSGNQAARQLGLADKDGMIDVDAAASALKSAIRAHGKLPVDIPLLDIKFEFSEKDIDALLSYIGGAERSGHV